MRLYSYEKVWKIDKRMYSFMNISLPTPVKVADLGYFAALVIFMKLLSSLIPALLGLNFFARYAIIPYLGMKILRTKKLDGKNPLRYFWDYILYLMNGRKQIENFVVLPPKGAVLRCKWGCTTRTT